MKIKSFGKLLDFEIQYQLIRLLNLDVEFLF
jgi:hypothetical protein